jgi:hypothetical protein
MVSDRRTTRIWVGPEPDGGGRVSVFMPMRSVIDKLQELVSLYRANPTYELEGSVGVYDYHQHTYTPGVSFAYFHDLHQLLTRTSTEHWSKSGHADHFASFYYPGSIRGRFSPAAKDPNFVTKTRVAKLDIACPERRFILRISLNSEVPSPIPVHGPQSVRLHERTLFVYKKYWSYELSKVASGQTKEDACGQPCIFDIELELNRKVLEDSSLTDNFIAQSFIGKLLDLLGRFDHKRKKQPLSLDVIKYEQFAASL